MNLPRKYEVLIITLSDRAFNGGYKDLSGPRIAEMLSAYLSATGWQFEITRNLIPDEPEIFRELLKSAGEKYNLIFTTGGTGIGPRDITIETVVPMLSREIPGIMEFIRIKYGTLKPNALLSRGVAGVLNKALIYTLPGSLKAVEEYMEEILKTLQHTVYMQYGIDTHSKH
jgi:molybdenum cofactor synthesis domain-containing protein